MPNPDNRALYEKYREMAEQEPGVAFVGRLAPEGRVPGVPPGGLLRAPLRALSFVGGYSE